MRRRALSPEEEALWRKATRDVALYRRQGPAAETVVSEASPSRGPLKKRARQGLKQPAARQEAQPAPVDRLGSGDPRFDRLAGRGRLEIDAVLDLHGHTQATARTALHRFIAAGHASGARCLLVITGKGAGEAQSSAGRSGAGRGVLRARFSDWINEEAVRPLVSRAARAHQRHGGAGAFYVFLKR